MDSRGAAPGPLLYENGGYIICSMWIYPSSNSWPKMGYEFCETAPRAFNLIYETLWL